MPKIGSACHHYSFRFQNDSFLFGSEWSVRLGSSVSKHLHFTLFILRQNVHPGSLGLKLILLRIQKWVRLHICHPFWTMDNVGRVSLNVSVCDILIRREGLHHCDYWLVSSLSWVPNQTGLCSEQSGSDCCDCPRTVLSLNTQIHNSNEYTKLGSQENKAKIGVLIDTNIILIMGHSLIIEIDFAHRLNKLKFFPLLNLKIEPVRFSQYYYC